MVRDFTNAAKEKLLEKIDEVNEEQLCGFTDWLGDGGLYVQEYTGFLDIEKYKNKVDKYHKKVLDQHDADKAAINRIFANVQDADDLYEGKLETLYEKMKLFGDKMGTLRTLINPDNGVVFTSSSVSTAVKDINTKINCEMKDFYTDLDAEIAYAEVVAAKEAAKGIVGDIFGVGGEIFDFALNVMEGDITGAALNLWGTVDKSFALFQDSTALLTVGMAGAIGATRKLGADDVRTRVNQMTYLTQSKDYASRDGFADEFDEETDFGKGVHIASDSLSLGKDAYNVYKGGKRIKDNAVKIKQIFTDKRYNTGNRLGELILGEFGFKSEITGKGDTLKVVFDPGSELKLHEDVKDVWEVTKESRKIYRSLSRKKALFSNAKTLWGFGETVIFGDGETAKNITKSSSTGGELANIFKFGDNLEEYFTKYFSVNLPATQ